MEIGFDPWIVHDDNCTSAFSPVTDVILDASKISYVSFC